MDDRTGLAVTLNGWARPYTIESWRLIRRWMHRVTNLDTQRSSGAVTPIRWAFAVLWRRVEVSRTRYVAVSATLSLALSNVAAGLYWLVVVQTLALGALPPASTPHQLEILFAWVLLFPPVETLVVAALVGVARLFTRREALLVLVVAVSFGLLHVFNGRTPADAGGHAAVSVVTFLIFGAVYVAWRRASVKDAFWMGTAVHMVHNLVMGIVAVIGPGG